MKSMVAARLREVLSYEPATGEFRWLKQSRRAIRGVIAGTIHREGYRLITIDGSEFKAHRLAWLYMHGEMPEGMLDHINGDRDDNRIANLRIADGRLNSENRKGARSGKLIPLMGVQRQSHGGRFSASIKVDGKYLWLGVHDTPEAAHAVYMAAKAQHHIGAKSAFEGQAVA